LPYATVEELAAALHIRVTPENTPTLEVCLAAAASEIDQTVDREPDDPIPVDDPLANRVNVARAVEWWKAADAAFGVIGFNEVGALNAPKDGFARYANALTPLRQRWAVA
jgi:hypothetical protein